MTAQYLAMDTFWVDKSKYDEAETQYYACTRNAPFSTPLADEVAKARQRLIQIRENFDEGSSVIKDVNAPVKGNELGTCTSNTMDPCAVKFLEKKMNEFQDVIMKIQSELSRFDARLVSIEKSLGNKVAPTQVCQKPAEKPSPKEADDDDDDVDLFGSESEDDEAATKVKEERLAAYNAKKSKKPALIAKSSIILDIKPWDDETDMKAMEAEVRKIEMEGLLWGASKLVPLAYGIHKLQINCVVEDDKVSIDELQEKIETIEDFVQSVDIAAFNKI